MLRQVLRTEFFTNEGSVGRSCDNHGDSIVQWHGLIFWSALVSRSLRAMKIRFPKDTDHREIQSSP